MAANDLNNAIDMLTEISDRADALGISLVKYPVEDVRTVLAAVRRSQMRLTTPAGRAALAQAEKEGTPCRMTRA